MDSTDFLGTEETSELVRDLALFFTLGNISQDNRSFGNGYNPFEQIVLYEFSKYMERDDVKDNFWEIREEIENCIQREKPQIEAHKKSYVEGLSDIRGLINIKNRRISKEIMDIAIKFLEGSITDDNPSVMNGFTALEQLVQFHFRYDIKSPDDFDLLLKAIKKTENNLRGGSYLIYTQPNPNFIWEDFRAPISY